MTLFTRIAGGIFGFAALLAISVSQSWAQSVSDIIGRGKVSIGVLTGVPPLTRTGPNGEDIGYHVDVAKRIAEYLGVEAEIVPVTNSSRIAALESRRIDIQVAQSAATPERARSIMFTIPYGGFNMVVYAQKSIALASFADMKGRKIAVARGGTHEQFLLKQNVPGMQVIGFESDAIATQALLSGQVDAAATADITVQDIIRSKPEANLEIKFPMFTQTYSIGVRKDAFELHQWLNTTLAYMHLNGEIETMHQKWVGIKPPPLPPF